MALNGSVALGQPVENCSSSRYSVELFDQAKPGVFHSISELDDGDFRSYAESLTSSLLKFLNIAEDQKTSAAPEMRVIFLRKTLINSDESATIADLRSTKFDAESPWFYAMRGQERCPTLIVFVWDERQFIVDHSIASSLITSPRLASSSETQSRLDGPLFETYANDYAKSIISELPENRDAALADIAKRLPAELIWLFQRAPQSTRGPFETAALSTAASIVSHDTRNYISFTNEILRNWITSTARSMKILDINGASSESALANYPSH